MSKISLQVEMTKGSLYLMCVLTRVLTPPVLLGVLAQRCWSNNILANAHHNGTGQGRKHLDC